MVQPSVARSSAESSNELPRPRHDAFLSTAVYPSAEPVWASNGARHAAAPVRHATASAIWNATAQLWRWFWDAAAALWYAATQLWWVRRRIRDAASSVRRWIRHATTRLWLWNAAWVRWRFWHATPSVRGWLWYGHGWVSLTTIPRPSG